MDKSKVISKVFIEPSIKDMDIPFEVLTKSGDFVKLTTSPELLFSSLAKADNQLGVVKKNLKVWQKAAIVGAIATGYLIDKNRKLKKELKVCKDELELEKEMNHMDI